MNRTRQSPKNAELCPLERAVFNLGRDVLLSSVMQQEKKFFHHGPVTCYDHSVSVAEMSLFLAQKLPLRLDAQSMVRGALLHDLYLYDWHVPDHDCPHRLHAFFHPSRALKNAEKHFPLNRMERDIIRKHMFPITIVPPMYRESWIVCIADTICAVQEWLRSVKGAKNACL